MKYTYYEIKNLVNNDLYIGITTQPIRRKSTHFRKLKQNLHPNSILQNAFNKYGENNFIFNILEEKEYESIEEAYNHEAFLIKKHNSFNKGYNCNPGGTWSGKRGKFSKTEIFYLNSVVYFEKDMCTVLSVMYKCPRSTVYSAVSGRTYTPWYNEFLQLSEEEKRDYYEEFCENSNFNYYKNKSKAKIKSRKYTKEQIFLILRWSETKFISFNELSKNLGYKGKNHFENIRSGKNYKDDYYEYKKLSEKEKQQIECSYKATYN